MNVDIHQENVNFVYFSSITFMNKEIKIMNQEFFSKNLETFIASNIADDIGTVVYV